MGASMLRQMSALVVLSNGSWLSEGQDSFDWCLTVRCMLPLMLCSYLQQFLLFLFAVAGRAALKTLS
jgi:hypothetical protein